MIKHIHFLFLGSLYYSIIMGLIFFLYSASSPIFTSLSEAFGLNFYVDWRINFNLSALANTSYFFFGLVARILLDLFFNRWTVRPFAFYKILVIIQKNVYVPTKMGIWTWAQPSHLTLWSTLVFDLLPR